MKNKHSIFWYIIVFPFILPFYIIEFFFLISKEVFLYILSFPFYVGKIIVIQICKILRISCPFKKTISGLEYEQYCASYLNSHGYKKASVTKSSGDHGVDIIAYKHGKKYAVHLY